MMAMGVVDTVMVGHLSARALAAVALGNLYFFGLAIFAIGTLMVLDPVVAQAVGARFCGVDIVRGADGSAAVLEVNSMPAWSGLQSVASIDVAAVLAEAFCRAIRSEAGVRAASR